MAEIDQQGFDPQAVTEAFGDGSPTPASLPAELALTRRLTQVGRYRIEGVLGKGGFGAVYLAYDEQLDRLVAIKVPHARLVATPDDAEAYLDEARTVARLDHPHIVPVHDVGSTPECPCFIVSKYIEGTVLSARLKTCRLSHVEAAELVATVAEALHHAHKQGLVHRDIKTGNILVGADGRPYIVDFGLALREENIGKGPKYVGTPTYMSPEQARGEGHRIDGRSDVFSLGVVMYELLTGRQPFKADSVKSLLQQISAVEARPCRQIDDAIPIELERICQKAMAKRASDRYSTAKDMAVDLRHFLAASHSAGTPTTSRYNSGDTFITPLISSVTPRIEPDRVDAKVVPKGLRSFDAGDSEFFLELLPGPRDRNGLPESIRFWKTRIESAGDDAFAVGLIYGPSGCGKSSLVKAGLLPRLAPSVTCAYIEATAEETERRLLRVLRRQLPELPVEFDLAESLAALRRGEFLAPDQNVLLVLDQFEQWLHAHQNDEDAELVHALRQCDGGRVRCLIMVRDDFWLAVSRFMKSMEVEILEGRNSALVDLFDPIHARRVLAAFGRAYGLLSDSRSECTAEQDEFLDQAVAGLTQEGKVISVRLALFAEMFKGRPWTPASLKSVGGAEGVGVTFLEETFSAPLAPPEHRRHQKAARAVLQALLPESGAYIKGHMRSKPQLLEASGYADRPREFEALIRILDGELRLITPTDSGRHEDASPTGPADARYYQLTHDYLVPSLVEWLSRRQKATYRGRAELRLADRSAYWNAKPESRRLPAFWEWANILLFTHTRDWTGPQRTMMKQASRSIVFRAAVLTACGGLMLWGLRDALGRMRGQALVDNLLHAQTVDAPTIVQNMAPYRGWVERSLKERRAAAEAAGDQRTLLHTSLALLPTDVEQVPYLSQRLLAGSPQEVAAISAALQPHAASLHDAMWSVLNDRQADPGQRLRAACFLAEHDPVDEQWPRVSGDVARRLALESPFVLKEWADALRPVAPTLLPALATLAADSRGLNERRTLAELYAVFATSVPNGFAPLEAVLKERPGVGMGEVVTLARQQATAVAALANAGRWDSAWPLLNKASDPTLRSYLVERLGACSTPQALVARLISGSERDASARQAIVLALGEFSEDRFSAGERRRLASVLSNLYRDDPDPGVHAAAAWLLESWGQKPAIQAIDQELAAGSIRGERKWYVTREGQTMVLVGPGETQFVDVAGQPHVVHIERPFAIGAREVTLTEYHRFRKGHVGDRQSAPTEDCPVNEVSWFDAAAYCNWLSSQEGIEESQWCYAPNDDGEYALGMSVKPDALRLTGYRLPTVQEWEFACRAGSVTRWSMGDAAELLHRYAWFANSSGMRTHPVGMLRPNNYGLFDMNGNVWEWCHNRFEDRSERAESGAGHTDLVDGSSLRALRGGTYLNDITNVGSTAEIRNPPYSQTGADGFRVARTMP